MFPDQPMEFFLHVLPERNFLYRCFQANAECRSTIAGHGFAYCFLLLACSIQITLFLSLVKMIKNHCGTNQHDENAQSTNYFSGYVLLKNQSNLILRVQI